MANRPQNRPTVNPPRQAPSTPQPGDPNDPTDPDTQANAPTAKQTAAQRAARQGRTDLHQGTL